MEIGRVIYRSSNALLRAKYNIAHRAFALYS
jgi:hypothetical protein